MIEKDYVLDLIDDLIGSYKQLQRKAMDINNECKVNQFTGSMIALQIMRDRVEGV